MGDMRVIVWAGLGGGIWLDSGVAVGVRGSGQAHEDVEAGGELAFAYNLELDAADDRGHPQLLGFARAFARHNPASLQWMNLDYGLGFALSDHGLFSLTLDSGANFGHPFDFGRGETGPAGRFLLYGGPVAALSVPLVKGDPIANDSNVRWESAGPHTPRPMVLPTPTFFVGATGGVGVESAAAFSMGSSLEGAFLYGQSSTSEVCLFGLSLGNGGGFTP